MRDRLDRILTEHGLVSSRSQAESYIRMGNVKVNGQIVTKSGQIVSSDDTLVVTAEEQFVSRAALKLKSADEVFHIDWQGKTVLDVGSSTGGFTQYALTRGAQKVIAVDVGTNQLHPSLRGDARVELHEKTDIRNFYTKQRLDVIVGDVSFISLRGVLPHVSKLMSQTSLLIAMVKPQFEVGDAKSLKNNGVIKNDRMRRDILKGFETWSKQHFLIINKVDSSVAGSKGNIERFYLLRLARKTSG